MADPARITHLLRRTEYVARPARVTALSAANVTLEQAVDDVLAFSPTPVPLPGNLTYHGDNNGYDQWVSAVKWWCDRMVDSPKPMQEKMTFFWHSHFCSEWSKVQRTDAMMNQNKLFRDQALGNFRSLVHAMSLQPAMLIYLDNIYNSASSPNQNFARELMELFTMGVGNYTEEDVAAAAAAWTGYGIDWDTYQYRFWPGEHDNGQKTFMGRTFNFDGPGIIDEILVNRADKRLITCKYLSKKLWEAFAYQNPEQQIVDDLAAVLNADLEIRPWVKAMLLREEFYSDTAREGLVRTPVDFYVAVSYHSGFRANRLNPQWNLDGMGMVPFNPPNVSGWRPNAYWLNTSMFGGRAEFARGATWPMRENDQNSVRNYLVVSEAIDWVASKFQLELTATSRAALEEYLTAQRVAEPWRGWWESTNLLTMAMLTPEYHLA